MTKTRTPAIEGWFTTEGEPALLGTRCRECGTYFFPRETTFCRNPACRSTALDEVPLSSWRERRQAIPAKVAAARQAAAKKLEPKSVSVTPTPATLRTPAEVEAYITALRERLMQHIADGETVII